MAMFRQIHFTDKEREQLLLLPTDWICLLNHTSSSCANLFYQHVAYYQKTKSLTGTIIEFS